MARSANVTSLEVMRNFKQSLARFAEESSNALLALQQEIYRALDWIEHDRPHFWRAQVRKGYDQVAQARVELERARMREVAGHRPTCYEEKQALALAKKRLEIAREKVEIVKRWSLAVREEVDEYRGRIGGLERCLEADIPKTLAMLERASAALEGYVAIQAADDDLKTATRPDNESTD